MCKNWNKVHYWNRNIFRRRLWSLLFGRVHHTPCHLTVKIWECINIINHIRYSVKFFFLSPPQPLPYHYCESSATRFAWHHWRCQSLPQALEQCCGGESCGVASSQLQLKSGVASFPVGALWPPILPPLASPNRVAGVESLLVGGEGRQRHVLCWGYVSVVYVGERDNIIVYHDLSVY